VDFIIIIIIIIALNNVCVRTLFLARCRLRDQLEKLIKRRYC